MQTIAIDDPGRLSVCRVVLCGLMYKHGWTDRGPAWDGDSWGPTKHWTGVVSRFSPLIRCNLRQIIRPLTVATNCCCHGLPHATFPPCIFSLSSLSHFYYTFVLQSAFGLPTESDFCCCGHFCIKLRRDFVHQHNFRLHWCVRWRYTYTSGASA